MNETKKAAPREKPVAADAKRYRVTHAVHFIGGNLQPVGAIVQLPAGVKPGQYLVEVGVDGEPISPAKGQKAE